MAGVLKLIQKNVSMWELRDRYEDEAQRRGRILHQGVSYGPCLLLSRECGTEGTDVGRAVGKRLGWEVFDREIVDQIAQLAHVRQSLVQSVDERVRSKWEETWRTVLMPENVGSERYQQYLRQVVLTLGHHGEVVIIGRGAHYILPPQCALRVRVIAPLEFRAKRIAERDGITLEQARTQLHHCASERAEFVRRFFHGDIRSPLDYDLVINAAEISSEAATELILTGLHEKLGVLAPALAQKEAI